MITRRSRANRRKEFELACLEHLDALYAAALKLTRSPTDAEELVQDTFLRAFRFAAKFEWGTNLKAWLFRIQTNAFINEYRHRGRERRYLERAATEPIYEEVFNKEAAAYASNPETHAFAAFFKKDLDRALEDLPDDFRIVVILADMEGFSYKEIAKMIDCPIGTVMSRLHRGRQILRRELVDYAVEAGLSVPESDLDRSKDLMSLAAYRQRKKGSA
ncbi:MAG: sigma-70 family RNA polymerase sigma factor [Myxococcota bacterium]|nr:sigma-70 family RNA polymerase sigma factor [Myxococcota bacterium]